DQMMAYADNSDIIISCAAVADFTPEEVIDGKLKRGTDQISIKLKPTRDIAAELGKRKKAGQILVGFALEADNEKENALSKLERKNLDMIVLNSLNDAGAGFGVDTNKVTIISRDGTSQEYTLKSKLEVAQDIVEQIVKRFL
ncbi:phosphopantothenoylcysteine decarboxylase, partial [Odoribacter sp. OttesenSCG-928-J03]|nr:phosphopantothenoylcysteine decarboxylase [Odoribacter sp. OttesenSCG-928-J03]